MRCVICKQGDTHPGETTITLERHGTTMIFKKVPARICVNCGEAYLEEAVSTKLLETAEEAARSGVLVDVREYTSAAA